MDYVIKKAFETAGDIIKLFVIAVIVIVMVQYTMLNIAAYRTMKEAEKTGYLDKAYYENKITSLIKFDSTKIVVEKVKPAWNVPVNKLGDPLQLELSYVYTAKMFNKEIPLKFYAKQVGINNGYYGTGY